MTQRMSDRCVSEASMASSLVKLLCELPLREINSGSFLPIMSDSQKQESAETRVVPPKRKGLSRLVAAGVNSLKGLQATFQSEEAFRLEVYGLVLSTPFALWL